MDHGHWGIYEVSKPFSHFLELEIHTQYGNLMLLQLWYTKFIPEFFLTSTHTFYLSLLPPFSTERINLIRVRPCTLLKLVIMRSRECSHQAHQLQLHREKHTCFIALRHFFNPISQLENLPQWSREHADLSLWCRQEINEESEGIFFLFFSFLDHVV